MTLETKSFDRPTNELRYLEKQILVSGQAGVCTTIRVLQQKWIIPIGEVRMCANGDPGQQIVGDWKTDTSDGHYWARLDTSETVDMEMMIAEELQGDLGLTPAGVKGIDSGGNVRLESDGGGEGGANEERD